MTASISQAAKKPWWRWIARATAVALVALCCVVVVALRSGSRYRPLVVRSDSMAPAIRTGDIILTEVVQPGEVRVGDVVTFQDPSRAGELVTHRVTERSRQGPVFSFVTRGDANTGEERWSIGADGTVGTLAFRVPGAGYLTTWLATPWVRTALLGLVAVLLAVVSIRWIWSRPTAPPVAAD